MTIKVGDIVKILIEPNKNYMYYNNSGVYKPLVVNGDMRRIFRYTKDTKVSAVQGNNTVFSCDDGEGWWYSKDMIVEEEPK